jgi:hypothetical protein
LLFDYADRATEPEPSFYNTYSYGSGGELGPDIEAGADYKNHNHSHSRDPTHNLNSSYSHNLNNPSHSHNQSSSHVQNQGQGQSKTRRASSRVALGGGEVNVVELSRLIDDMARYSVYSVAIYTHALLMYMRPCSGPVSWLLLIRPVLLVNLL